MDNSSLFTIALQLETPWKVSHVGFLPEKDDPKDKALHITIAFERGSKFKVYKKDGTLCVDEAGNPIETTAHDTVERTWQHLSFFQYKTYIHAKVPRVVDDEGHCHTVKVPWARKNSGFTLLFEAWVIELAKHMSVSEVAELLNVRDKRLWRFIKYYVDKAREQKDLSQVTSIGIDETSKKGHNYITVMVDLTEREVIFTTEGKDHTTVDKFTNDFKEHNGNPENVKVVTCDMSLGFKKGINDNFPNSATIIDKFHVIKHANEAVDKVRKQESKDNKILKGTKYLWLKNEENLTENQAKKKAEILKSSKHFKTGRAYSMRVELQDIYEECQTYDEAESRFKKLCSWLSRSRLEPMKKLCSLIRDHWKEILNYFEYNLTNAILEGINSIIQNIKRRARGFRNNEYFTTMIYLNCSNLDIDGVFAKE